MNKPKIAVLIDWYLPGTKAGGPVRSVYSLISVLKSDFDFYLITGNRDLGCADAYKEIVPNQLFEKQGVHYYFFSQDQLNKENMQKLLSQINPSLIYLNSFWSVNFSINIVRLKNKGLLQAPLLLAPRGMLGKGALGIKSFKKRLFLGLAKLTKFYRSVTFHATQKQEQQDIQAEFPKAQILTAPNINSSPVLENTTAKSPKYLKLFFLSRISEVKNLHFALELLSEIPKEYHIDYDIFGNLESSEYWDICMKLIERLPENINVQYKKEIQFNEVQNVISHYHFLLMPTLNENFGHSIVESLLSGCPVIISDQTPWNDLEENNAGYAISLSNRKRFAEAIIEAANLNQNDFTEKSKAANKYISKKTDLSLIVTHYKNLFNDSIKN